MAEGGKSGPIETGRTDQEKDRRSNSANEDEYEEENYPMAVLADRIMEVLGQIMDCLDEDEIGQIKTILSRIIEARKNKDDDTVKKFDEIYCDFLNIVEFRYGISVHMIKQAIRGFMIIEEDKDGLLGQEVYEMLLELILIEHPSLVRDMNLHDELLKVYFKLVSEGHERAKSFRSLLFEQYGFGKSTLSRRQLSGR